jgi:hypothetical protein
MRLRGVLQVFGIVAFSGTTKVSTPPAQLPSCNSTRWKAPTDVQALAHGTVEHLDIAVGQKAGYILGTVAVPDERISETRVRDSQSRILLISTAGATLAQPGRFGQAIAPEAAIGRDGTLHVVWGQPSTHDSPRHLAGKSFRGPVRAATLWYAERKGRNWSAPRLLYRARSIDWGSPASSKLILDQRGLLHVAATGVSITGHWMLLHGARSAHGWRFTALQPPTPPIYADVAANANGETYLTFIGGRGGLFGMSPAVQLIRSRDGGASWTSPIAVSGTTEGPPHEPRLVIDDKNVLHIVWMERAPNSLDAVRVWHAQLDNANGNWIHYASANLSGLVTRSQIAMDSCERIHLVFEQQTRIGVQISHAVFRTGAWSSTSNLSLIDARLPALTSDPWKRLHLVWQRIGPYAGSGHVATSLVYSELPSTGKICPAAC